jgi:hypothetical protein
MVVTLRVQPCDTHLLLPKQHRPNRPLRPPPLAIDGIDTALPAQVEYTTRGGYAQMPFWVRQLTLLPQHQSGIPPRSTHDDRRIRIFTRNGERLYERGTSHKPSFAGQRGCRHRSRYLRTTAGATAFCALRTICPPPPNTAEPRSLYSANCPQVNPGYRQQHSGEQLSVTLLAVQCSLGI